MDKNLKGELAIMDGMGIKPNYAALGRKYGMDWRTVKKYHNGYEGRTKTRKKGSKLDAYRNEIADKLKIRRLTVQGVYEFMIKKYGIERIGTYSNFNKYVAKQKLKPKRKKVVIPDMKRNPVNRHRLTGKKIFPLLTVMVRYSRLMYFISHLSFPDMAVLSFQFRRDLMMWQEDLLTVLLS